MGGHRAGPAIAAPDLLPISLALITHDHDMGHLDKSGRALLPNFPEIITTLEGAARLGIGTIGLGDHSSTTIGLPEGGELVITALPAQQGPEIAHTTRQVIGLRLVGDAVPKTYIGGTTGP